MIGRLKRYMAERRAAADAVRLFSGEISPEDERRMAGWSQDKSNYGTALLETAQAVARLDGLVDDPLLMSVVDDGKVVDKKIVDEKADRDTAQVTELPAKRGWGKVAVAAGVLMASVIGFEIVNSQLTKGDDGNIQRYVTRVGEQKTVDLKDGSQITLNTSTQLLVDYSAATRRLVLERGEAYFDVVKDPSRPFTVDLGNRSVTALGTEFNIHRLPEVFTLAVTEGVVSLHRREDVLMPSSPVVSAAAGKQVELSEPGQVRIQAGTVAVFDVEKRRLVAHNPEHINSFQSWRDRVIRFDSTPLYEVAKELNRYSAKKILIEDDSIMNLDLYATVHLDHLNEALAVFERALPIKVMQRVDRIVIVRKK